MNHMAAGLTLFALASATLAQSPAMEGAPKAGAAMMDRGACAHARAGSDEERNCMSGKGRMTAPQDPKALLEAEPTAAGRPQALTRRQVVMDLERARARGELDRASEELGLSMR